MAPVRPPSARRRRGRPATLELFNGIGGFADEGREYVIDVDLDAGRAAARALVERRRPSDVRVRGDRVRARLHLVPQQPRQPADALAERSGRPIRQARRCSSATRRPGGSGPRRHCRAGAGAPYTVRHGQGYTSFEHARDGLASTLLLFVPPTDPVKVYRLTLRNDSAGAAGSRSRCMSSGCSARTARARICTSSPAATTATGALFARNAFRQEFAQRQAFLDLHPGAGDSTVTGDRTEFIGRNGTARHPAAMRRAIAVESHRLGARSLRRDPGGGRARAVGNAQRSSALLGDALDADEARDARPAATAIPPRWTRRCIRCAGSGIGCSARSWCQDARPAAGPDAESLAPVPGLACRIWGRSAFYQSSGAFGFRDQLQDVLALLLCRAAARAHVTSCMPPRPAVRRGRRPALVARAGRPGRAHAFLRRSSLAGLRGAALRGFHRGRRRARRRGAVSPGTAARSRRTRGVRAPVGLARAGIAVRALRSRRRAQPRGRRRTDCR